MKTDGVYIYSFVADRVNPLMLMYSSDLLFLRENNKLRWLQMYKSRRFCDLRTKDSGDLFDSIDDFLANPPKGFDINLDYKYNIIERKSNHNIGEYYKNIYRPVISYKLQNLHQLIDDRPLSICDDDISIWGEYKNEYSSHIRQLELILDELKSVFKVVEPTQENLQTYGNTIRNIIILACTEIDSMMKKILKNNGIILDDKEYTTKQYFKLKEALRLGEYELQFKEFEHLGIFSPFLEWEINRPTQSLPWYDAYNKIKHDREANFQYANVKNALNSIVAYAILLIAQYGHNNPIWEEHMRKFFSIIQTPSWSLEDFYVPHSTLNFKQTPIDYPF
jgi:hypothetical protein